MATRPPLSLDRTSNSYQTRTVRIPIFVSDQASLQSSKRLRRYESPPTSPTRFRFEPAMAQIPLVHPRHENLPLSQQRPPRTATPHLPRRPRRSRPSNRPSPKQSNTARRRPNYRPLRRVHDPRLQLVHDASSDEFPSLCAVFQGRPDVGCSGCGVDGAGTVCEWYL